MITALVWLLITGSDGGHVAAAQLGPFAAKEDCQRVMLLEMLRRYERTCVQVTLVLNRATT